MKFDLKNEFWREKARAYLAKLIDKSAQVEITEKKPRRTINQNRYYWVLVQLFAIETGYTRDEAHAVIKRRDKSMVYRKNGLVFLKSTTELDTKEMSDYVERFRKWAALEGIDLPDADGYRANACEYDNLIEQHRNQL